MMDQLIESASKEGLFFTVGALLTGWVASLAILFMTIRSLNRKSFGMEIHNRHLEEKNRGLLESLKKEQHHNRKLFDWMTREPGFSVDDPNPRE